jgi:hypothetical protein
MLPKTEGEESKVSENKQLEGALTEWKIVVDSADAKISTNAFSHMWHGVPASNFDVRCGPDYYRHSKFIKNMII